MTVNDVLDALEADPDFFRADVFITPPGDGTASDEDSASEDEVAKDSHDNLTRNQLNAEAHATIIRSSCEKEVIGDGDDEQTSGSEMQNNGSTYVRIFAVRLYETSLQALISVSL